MNSDQILTPDLGEPNWLEAPETRTVGFAQTRKQFCVLAGFVVVFHLFVAAVMLPAGLPINYWPAEESTFLLILFIGCLATGILFFLGVQVGGDLILKLRGGQPPQLRQRFSNLGRMMIFGWVLTAFYVLVHVGYVNVKPAVPLLNSQNYDTQLEHLERGLFGGVLPTEWLAARSSRGMMAFWDVIYGLFGMFLFLSLACALNLEGLSAGIKFVLVLSIGYLLDLVVTILLPTKGPIFVHPEWFADLHGLSSASLADFLHMTVHRYAERPGTVYACAGISAMPSYHVYGWTCGLMCWRRLPRWLFLGAVVLTLLNWASTVVLGWHYFLDGLVGTVLALVVWYLVSRFWRGLEQPSDPHSALL